MGVQNQEFVFNEPVALQTPGQDIPTPPRDVLPEVPRTMLERILSRMTAAERDYALQQRLVPITWLPHLTLYADAAPSAGWRVGRVRERIVARIAPQDFHTGMRKLFRKTLAERAAMGLRRRAPVFSAHERFSRGQAWMGAVALVVAAGLCAVVSASLLAAGFGLLCSLIFLCVIWLRGLALWDAPPVRQGIAERDDAALPVYSVLVPLFRETRVLAQLLGALEALDYPRDKLDIKLILEESDTGMQRAVARAQLPAHIEVVIVPAGKPQTKPRALNYALQFARGSLVTIYDAEDIPEPQQLRIAAHSFGQAPEAVACLQAELAFYNPNENWLTRQFTAEYATQFKLILPALAKYGLPLPLGGTSNHFRAAALRAVGGWDPYNVTEDADLGFRLARLGYATRICPSITYEEANTQLGNWLRQRARWLKGFLQTWLVHMRSPHALLNEIGWGGFFILQATTLGITLAATAEPLFLAATANTLYHDLWAKDADMLATALNASTVGFMLVGGGISLLASAQALMRKGLHGWGLTLLTMPLYWLLASLAGWMALWQFIDRPFHWNKTQHGLSRLGASPPSRGRSKARPRRG